MNVALYGRGVRRWAMTERGAEALSRSASRLEIGRSAVDWQHGVLAISIDEITAPFPRRLRGKIRVEPQALTSYRAKIDASGRHRWWPIAPAARVEARFDYPALSWSGHGYFDCNAGDEPLEAAFRSWTWSRATMRNGTAILYDLERRTDGLHSLALKFDANGGHRELHAPRHVELPRTTIWQMPRSTPSEGNGTAKIMQTLEDAPFYARSMIRSRLLGQDCVAMHESLSLDRFNSGWVQALLPFRMPRRRKAPAPR